MNIELNPVLRYILETKRPTNNPLQNLTFIQKILNDLGATPTTDQYGNVTVRIGQSNTAFTAHTDTVENKLGVNELEVSAEGLVTVKGGGILGADDGSGMYILLRMIAVNKPGVYVFFATEELGRIGSENYTMSTGVNKVISFDRKGVDNLITHQMGERGCSDAFADAFIAGFGLPYKKDPTGSFTDSYSFFGTVSECINLSVGYYNQHSKNESQDVVFLEQLVDACIAMDWESLPAERDYTQVQYDDADWGKIGYGYAGSVTRSYKDDHYHYGLTEIDRLEDFCYDHPTVVAEVLLDYGITVTDLIKYKNLIDEEGVNG